MELKPISGPYEDADPGPNSNIGSLPEVAPILEADVNVNVDTDVRPGEEDDPTSDKSFIHPGMAGTVILGALTQQSDP
jgi:hypothetical protein